MEHKIIPTTWKTREALEKAIRDHEAENWNVAALGKVFGGDVLVLMKDDEVYQHEVISVFWKTRDKLEKLIAEKEVQGWQVCSLGECFGGIVMILKRPRSAGMG